MIDINFLNNFSFSDYKIFDYIKDYKKVYVSDNNEYVIIVLNDSTDSFTISIDKKANLIQSYPIKFLSSFGEKLLSEGVNQVFFKPFKAENASLIEKIIEISDYHITMERSPYSTQEINLGILDANFNLKEIKKNEYPISLDVFFNSVFFDKYPFDIDAYKKLFEMKNEIIYLLQHKDEIICALMGYFVSKEKFYLCLLGVKDTYRNNGIASYLLKKLINQCADKIIYLGVYKSNIAAISLYSKFGFTHKKTNLLITQLPFRTLTANL
jgi:GNAT superfamily N-acetyltransferase